MNLRHQGCGGDLYEVQGRLRCTSDSCTLYVVLASGRGRVSTGRKTARRTDRHPGSTPGASTQGHKAQKEGS